MIDKAEAIRSLGYNFYGGEDTGFTFYDDSGNPLDNPPTEAEIDAEVIRLQEEYDAQEYARKRQAEYPPWNEQLDKIFHDGVAKWKSEMVQPVKNKYPKPE